MKIIAAITAVAAGVCSMAFTSGHASAQQAAVTCPAGYPSAEYHASWKNRLEGALANTDTIARANALLSLVREALPGREVRLAGNASPYKPHPDDYTPYPVINFDPHLVDKRDSPSSYYFTSGSNAYVVIGLSSLHVRGPVTTIHYVAHEAYHVDHHIGDVRPTIDKELELQTQIFINTFHWTYPYKLLWNPLMSSYENASPAEQGVALYQLVSYYRTPPATIPSACVSEMRAEFEGWLSRRINDEKGAWKKLINALQKELQIRVIPPAPKPTDTASAPAAVAAQATLLAGAPTPAPTTAAVPQTPKGAFDFGGVHSVFLETPVQVRLRSGGGGDTRALENIVADAVREEMRRQFGWLAARTAADANVVATFQLTDWQTGGEGTRVGGTITIKDPAGRTVFTRSSVYPSRFGAGAAGSQVENLPRFFEMLFKDMTKPKR